ncbi:hypothetical protein Ahy_B05g076414 [Arachis hypogaea]|uniref:Uncharacterized protein n=1 Tax=Arachis hypogaea TaxID=3818 RepID=A0A444Z361_ARAHY|nr:hypothetical protein Ahy_B05g076414 [Arachis hypogaea]
MARDQTRYRTPSPPLFANLENMEKDENTPITCRVLTLIRKMSLPKWAPEWEGPYIVSEVHPNGHRILLDPDHGITIGPINFKYVKQYYA